MVRKVIVVILCISALSLSACGSASSDSAASESVDKESVETESVETNNASEEQSEPSEGSSESEQAYEITYQRYQLIDPDTNGICIYAIVEIENTGTTNLQLQEATFTLLDGEGNLAGVASGMISADPDIIAPGERGYFYTNGESVNGEIDVNGNYTFVPELSVKETRSEPVNYELTDISMSDGTYGVPAIMGRITNTTDRDASMIWVVTVLFDYEDHPLAAFGTNVLDVAAGETKTFDADAVYLLGMDLSYGDIARYETFACK